MKKVKSLKNYELIKALDDIIQRSSDADAHELSSNPYPWSVSYKGD